MYLGKQICKGTLLFLKMLFLPFSSYFRFYLYSIRWIAFATFIFRIQRLCVMGLSPYLSLYWAFIYSLYFSLLLSISRVLCFKFSISLTPRFSLYYGFSSLFISLSLTSFLLYLISLSLSLLVWAFVMRFTCQSSKNLFWAVHAIFGLANFFHRNFCSNTS